MDRSDIPCSRHSHVRVHRVHGQRREKNSDPVREASGRQKDVRRSEHIPSREGCDDRSYAIIFTYAIVGLPATIAQFFPNSGFANFVTTYFSSTSALYIIIAFVLIIAFNFFYISIQYNPVEISNNIKNNGGTIPGIRPGKPTSDFIIRVVNRVTIVGALFLGVIATIPYILEAVIGSAMQGLALGGTSVMIVVSVALETVKQLESQMLMRQSKGFLR